MPLSNQCIDQIMPDKKIIFAGAGGHALSLAEAVSDRDLIEGYISLADSPKMTGRRIGDDAAGLALVASGDFLFHIAFVYSGLPVMDKRKALISMYEEAGAHFATIVAASAIITPNSYIGEGSAILNGAIVNRACIGRHCVINSGAIVEHDCIVGDNTFIGPGTVIGGGVEIGSDCFIGLGAKVKNGVRISSGVTVAMGAIVDRNLEEPGIYHGQPLRLHSFRRD